MQFLCLLLVDSLTTERHVVRELIYVDILGFFRLVPLQSFLFVVQALDLQEELNLLSAALGARHRCF